MHPITAIDVAVVPLVANTIISPATESAMTWRNEPTSLSAKVVTVFVPLWVVKLKFPPEVCPSALVATTR
jgi:hypothetical protein